MKTKSMKDDLVGGLKSVAAEWKKTKLASEWVPRQRLDYMRYRVREDTMKDLVWEVMGEAYNKASSNGRYYANARQIMYQARALVKNKNPDAWKQDSTFQVYLKEYILEERPSWASNVVWSAKGNFIEPHTKKPVDFDDLIECEICGRKFCISYDNEFCICSKSCYKIAKRDLEEYRVRQIYSTFLSREILKCKICGEAPKVNFEDKYYCYVEKPSRHNHHIDYNKDKTILLCPSCHTKITFHLDKHPELKEYEPIGSREDMLKRLEEEKKRKREERLVKREQKEIQKMTSRRGMESHSHNYVPYTAWNKSPMLGAWVK